MTKPQPPLQPHLNPGVLRAVFLDVDGVLLDSLPQHLRFCADKGREYGLQRLQMPSVEAFKRMVSSGTVVSPMLKFFLAVGFPEPLAKRGVEDYEQEFMRVRRPVAFPGINDMLKRLSDSGLFLGLVTSNTRANVEPALADEMHYFDPRCRFYFDRYPKPRDKAWCLREGARTLGLAPAQCVYVGDQPGDGAAARAADMPFLGVSYGWGLHTDEVSVYIVDSVPAIADALLASLALKG